MRFLSYGLVKSSLPVGLWGLAACSSPVATNPDGGNNPNLNNNLPTTCITVQRNVLGTVADTQIASDPSGVNQGRNFGSSSLLDVGPFNGGQSQLLIKMDPGPLPPILQFLSATMQIPVSQAANTTIQAYQVPVAWDEGSVTWNSFYGAAGPSPLTLVGNGYLTAGSTVLDLDLSQFAYAVGKGAPNNGLLLVQTGTDPAIFYSSESATIANRPSAQICFHPDLCANVTCAALDQCHTAGTCDPSTGKCPNPSKPDGTTCNDGSALTTSDVCTQGVCTGTPTGGGTVYPLFSGGPGFTCTTGSTVWVLSSGTLDPTSSAQAQAACEACYGTGMCYNSAEDSAGLSWGPMSAMPPSCGQAYFGYTTGITGDNGRAFTMCNSSKTFGYWGKQP
jgi:hypothetical protein